MGMKGIRLTSMLHRMILGVSDNSQRVSTITSVYLTVNVTNLLIFQILFHFADQPVCGLGRPNEGNVLSNLFPPFNWYEKFYKCQSFLSCFYQFL